MDRVLLTFLCCISLSCTAGEDKYSLSICAEYFDGVSPIDIISNYVHNIRNEVGEAKYQVSLLKVKDIRSGILSESDLIPLFESRTDDLEGTYSKSLLNTMAGTDIDLHPISEARNNYELAMSQLECMKRGLMESISQQ